MRPEERERVVQGLSESQEVLAAALAGVSAAQAVFREAPERWSIAEVVEHLVVWEDVLRGALHSAMSRPPENPSSELRLAAGGKDALVETLASRERRWASRTVAMPIGRWTDVAEMLELFRARRARTIAFARALEGDPRAHFFPHVVFGDLDCYQWLIAMGRHTLRHIGQIEEIRAAPGFPGA